MTILSPSKFALRIAVPLAALAMLFAGTAPAQESEPVTVHTFVRAESDAAIRKITDAVGLNQFLHYREPTPLDQQKVIRMNRDTIYSSAVLDLSRPATVIMPEADGRYMCLHVINQDHYSYAVSDPGSYNLIEDEVGSRYAYLIVRTFLDPDDPEDVKAANAAQDAIRIEGGGDGPLELPDWNQDQLRTAREALNTLAKLGANAARAFGLKDEVDPIDHLVMAGAGWGGLPQKNAFYIISQVEKNDGSPHVLNVKDVPVDGFWSVTVYGPDGYIHENDLGVYSYNSVTAKPNDDGSYTIRFGDCGGGGGNCLPISEGWNYAIRMYEPRPEILDGDWVFPKIEPVK